MPIYRFNFLGSVTECKYSIVGEKEQLVETGVPEPIILSMNISALSVEQARKKIRRVIAWDLERKISDTHV